MEDDPTRQLRRVDRRDPDGEREPRHLARYGDVYLDNCIAGTRNHDLLYAGSGDLITMTDSGNHAISTPQVETQELIKVQYTA